MRLPAPARDTALLLARLAVGAVFFAHGWQKLFTNGVDGTAAFFGQAGVPMPTLSTWFAVVVELVGGAALVLGLAVPAAALLLVIDMLGAFLFVHAGSGLFVAQNGYELVLVLAAASLVLGALGAGRFSLDHALLSRLRGSSRRDSSRRGDALAA
jgi:putative oxidoreductase